MVNREGGKVVEGCDTDCRGVDPGAIMENPQLDATFFQGSCGFRGWKRGSSGEWLERGWREPIMDRSQYIFPNSSGSHEL